ncbi:hypothetical protein SeMB42_g07737 [Synchytrium endobioticum]|uniref:Uncharacterized protein n=1 Tax=Synchytrium endobioticum TaxID=286115 RepID=A0A507BX00_9FUNG|nr:hypothetical protein SeMB42_g07737 [Synchytrium endobioticum]
MMLTFGTQESHRSAAFTSNHLHRQQVLDAFQDQTDLMDANGDNRDADLPTLRITANRLSDVGCLCIIL